MTNIQIAQNPPRRDTGVDERYRLITKGKPACRRSIFAPRRYLGNWLWHEPMAAYASSWHGCVASMCWSSMTGPCSSKEWRSRLFRVTAGPSIPSGGLRFGNPSVCATISKRRGLASLWAANNSIRNVWAEAIALNLLEIAASKTPSAIAAANEVCDRAEGRQSQHLQISDFAAELQARSDAESQFYLDNSCWPNDEESRC